MGDVEAKAKLKEKQDMLLENIIQMIPIVGPLTSITLRVREIKDKKEIANKAKELKKELEANRHLMSVDEIFMAEMVIAQYEEAVPHWKDYVWLGVDALSLGLDVAFLAQILVKTGARWNGRDALKVLEGEAKAGKVTTVEKDLFAQAAVELGDGAEDLYRIAAKKKGGWKEVATDLAKKAGDGDVDKKIMLEYLKENPIKKPGSLKKVGQKALDMTVGDLNVIGKVKFYKKMVAQFYRELIPNINFKAVSELSGMLKKTHLPKKLQERALSAIFYSMMSFNKKAQTALLELVKAKGWETVAKKITAREVALSKKGVKLKPSEDLLGRATRDVLSEMIPNYRMAYAEAPIIPWLENGLGILGMHTGFILLGEYIAAKSEKKEAELQKQLEELSKTIEDMEEPLKYMREMATENEMRNQVLEHALVAP